MQILDLQKTVKNNNYVHKNQKFHCAIGLLGLQCSRFNQHHSVIASYGHKVHTNYKYAVN